MFFSYLRYKYLLAMKLATHTNPRVAMMDILETSNAELLQ